MEGCRGKTKKRYTVHREICGVQYVMKERIEMRERLAVRNKVTQEEHLRDLRGVKRKNRNENVSARSIELCETLKLRFRVAGLDLPERKRYTRSRGEKEDAPMCPCGKAIEYNSHSGRMWNIQGGTGSIRGDEENRRLWQEKFGKLDSGDKTIAVRREVDDGHRRRNRKGIR